LIGTIYSPDHIRFSLFCGVSTSRLWPFSQGLSSLLEQVLPLEPGLVP
jgi:hypothetical protein